MAAASLLREIVSRREREAEENLLRKAREHEESLHDAAALKRQRLKSRAPKKMRL
jgi:vacuolar-type H+-ATPase subunit E/Vma4